MGNSNSQQQPNHTHSHQPFHPAFHQRGDLIRNGGPYPPHLMGPGSAKMPYNPECKVLPERVPGQKLRLTDNGAILHNGGTISGRPRSEGLSSGPGPDPELLQFMMRKRAEELHKSGYMNKPGAMPPDARYYSHPDLVMVPESHGDETDSSTSGRRFRKKTRAPPPPLSPSAMTGSIVGASERPISRTNSLHEGLQQPYYGRGPENGYINIQPWQQRQMNGNHPLTMSMEKIIERHQLVVQESRMSGAASNGRSETLPWNQRQSDSTKRYDRQQQPLPPPPQQRTTEITISHERRFYKNRLDNSSKKLSQSEQQLNGSKANDNGRQKLLMERAGVMNEERKKKTSETRPQARAKSMDSLQIAMELERKAHLQNLHKEIYKNNSADKNSRPSNKDDSFYRTLSMDGRIWDEPRKRPPSRTQEMSYSTGSLQRNLSPSAQYELYSQQKEHRQNEVKILNHRQYSPLDTKEHDSKNLNVSRSHRRELAHPKQYYFGEALAEEQEKPEPVAPVIVNHHRQRSGSGSGSSKPNDALHMPEVRQPPVRKSDAHSGSKKSENGVSPLLENSSSLTNSTDLPRSENKRCSPSRGHLVQGRNRNSYAFEDRRYRYDDISVDPLPEEKAVGIVMPVDAKTNLETIDDEMDISMQLRPMLPKRTPAIPRFSPTQAWRSLNLDHITSAQRSSDRSSDDGDVLEDRIHRITRPVAPPRVGNERSADSGISQDAGSPGGLLGDNELMVSHDKRSNGDTHNINAKTSSTSPPPPPLPLPTSAEPSSLETNLITEPGISPIEKKRTTWTPEEDLASDFDGASVDHYPIHDTVPEMVSVPPRLTPIKSMFANRTFVDIEIDEKPSNGKKSKVKHIKENGTFPINQSNNLTPHTFHSMRTLKRSLSGVLGTSTSTKGRFVDDLQNVDENWSFSRSLPNSLHNGHSGEELTSLPSQTKSTSPLSEFPGHYGMRRAESGPIHPSPTFLGLQARVLSADCLQESPSKPQNKNSSDDKFGDLRIKYSKSEHIIYLPEYDAKRIIQKEREMNGNDDISYFDDSLGSHIVVIGNNPKKGKKFTYQSTVRQQERKRLEQKLSQEVAHKEKQREREIHMVNKVEEEFQRKREREKASICLQLKVLTDSSHDLRDENSPTPPPPLMTPSQLSLFTEELSSSSSPLSSQPSDLSFSRHSPHDKLEKQDSGFFGGISKWMRRQQKLEEQQHQEKSAPIQDKSELNSSIIRFDPQEFSRQMELLDPRHQILSGAKFSSGVIPPEKVSPQPQLKPSAYKRLSELMEKEEASRSHDLDMAYVQANDELYLNSSKTTGVQVHRSESGRAVESAAEVQQRVGQSQMSDNHRYLKNGSNSSFGESSGSSESPTSPHMNGKLVTQWDHYPLDERTNGHKLKSSIEDSECSSDIETDHSNTHLQHSRYHSPKNRRHRAKEPSRSSSKEKPETNGKAETSTSTLTRLLGRRKHNKASKETKMNGHVDNGSNNWTMDNQNKSALKDEKAIVT